MNAIKSLVAATLGAAVLALAAPASAVPTLEFFPTAQTFLLGDPVSVEVRVTGLGTEIVAAYDLDVTYAASTLDATGVSFLANLGGPVDSLQDFVLAAGLVDFAEVSFLSDAELATLQGPLGGTVPLVTLEFTALADGDTSSLDFTFGPGQDVKGANNEVILPLAVPQPGALALLASGFGLLGFARFRSSNG